jgi:hypothetical protein
MHYTLQQHRLISNGYRAGAATAGGRLGGGATGAVYMLKAIAQHHAHYSEPTPPPMHSPSTASLVPPPAGPMAVPCRTA